MALMRFDENALEGEVVGILFEQTKATGRAVPDVVDQSAGTLS